MQRKYLLPLIIVLLSACVYSGGKVKISPSNTNIISTSSKMFQSATPTLITPETSPFSPSPTPVPPKLILSDYPLKINAIWKYSAEISYQDPNNEARIVTWSGYISDKVVDKKATLDGGMIFTLQEVLEPTPPREVWRTSSTKEYTIMGDGIFEGNIKIFQWPLSNKLTWKVSPNLDLYIVANYIGQINTSYGELNGCYSLIFATNPDTTIDTFCPSIGFVKHSYMHHGTVQIEDFDLLYYDPGNN
jgi:hypothetical protein